jgi:squalene-hopene/tetraprenyl-beta-curcumene cyclase
MADNMRDRVHLGRAFANQHRLHDAEGDRYDGHMNQSLRQQARETLDQLREELLAERTDDGHWVGELAASALSTATAISAMSAVLRHGGDAERWGPLIKQGLSYLSNQQNDDGGFGDTDRSHSNIATSYLALAASSLGEQATGAGLDAAQLQRLRTYIDTTGGRDALKRRYGKDKTFVVPILTNLAIAGLVDWDDVAALPFEAAVFPQSMYRLLRMPVVSYAIPALVAIGQARHFHGKKAIAPVRWIRAASIKRTMNVLLRMQPDSGGYLEATPLTSFVVMSLAVTGRADHPVTERGLRFLADSMRAEGSWPIDTNLATWVTSLAIHSLACDPADDGGWCTEQLANWHLGCQHVQRHPFTGAEPGGWGWSDLSGAVPDGDDTPAAILALHQMRRWVGDGTKARIAASIDDGADWLLQLQNRNGGWPTFCRGWGKLPFDRSSTDLTAHAMRALTVSGIGNDGGVLGDMIGNVLRRGRRFLARQQRDDGAWLPLWFGNQDLPDETNPVYGTSRVLAAAGICGELRDAERRAADYLLASQNPDGGWGGGASVPVQLQRRSISCPANLVSSVEETALAVEALSTVLLIRRDQSWGSGVESSANRAVYPADSPRSGTAGGNDAYLVAIIRGVDFLVCSVRDGRHRVAWPIGFYFAKLWYHERLYPLVFSVAALGKYLRATADRHEPDWPR